METNTNVETLESLHVELHDLVKTHERIPKGHVPAVFLDLIGVGAYARLVIVNVKAHRVAARTLVETEVIAPNALSAVRHVRDEYVKRVGALRVVSKT